MEEEKRFLDKYNFTNFQTVTVANPTPHDYEFQVTIEVGLDRSTGKMVTDVRKYVVKAGGHERFPGVVANMYLDGIAKIIAQGMKQGLAAIVDFNSRSQIYDDLIVEVEDLLNKTYIPLDDDLARSGESASENKEEAFAGAKKNAAK